ncbi:jg26065, partial [Pararge aegeria aegeria]
QLVIFHGDVRTSDLSLRDAWRHVVLGTGAWRLRAAALAPGTARACGTPYPSRVARAPERFLPCSCLPDGPFLFSYVGYPHGYQNTRGGAIIMSDSYRQNPTVFQLVDWVTKTLSQTSAPQQAASVKADPSPGATDIMPPNFPKAHLEQGVPHQHQDRSLTGGRCPRIYRPEINLSVHI